MASGTPRGVPDAIGVHRKSLSDFSARVSRWAIGLCAGWDVGPEGSSALGFIYRLQETAWANLVGADRMSTASGI